MTVTRDPDYPDQMAQLFQAFNRCADGHSLDQVLDAATNFYIAAIGAYAKAHGMTKVDAIDYAHRLGERCAGSVAENWQRKSQSSDVLVSDN